MNPNLDADLGTTIKKVNRKKINAEDFQIKDAVKSDTDTTHDRTRSGAPGSGGSR
jgi:hypothetical protein